MIDQEAHDLAVTTARIADSAHGTDILIFDVGDVLSLTEYFVVIGASNRRLVDALVDDIEEQVRDLTDRSPIRVEGAREHQWVLIDYGDVIVHVFLAEIRAYYEIERLYSDVAKVDWAEAASPTGTD